MNQEFKTVDEYINSFNKETKERLNIIRSIIKELVPDAAEVISYKMPTYKLNGNLIHFAAFKNHIGIYPTPRVIEQLSRQLLEYKTSKGAIQFPNNKDLPLNLIEKIIKERVREKKHR